VVGEPAIWRTREDAALARLEVEIWLADLDCPPADVERLGALFTAAERVRPLADMRTRSPSSASRGASARPCETWMSMRLEVRGHEQDARRWSLRAFAPRAGYVAALVVERCRSR
jgi:hypothetical protein